MFASLFSEVFVAKAKVSVTKPRDVITKTQVFLAETEVGSGTIPSRS
jgi:hypothetical protein